MGCSDGWALLRKFPVHYVQYYITSSTTLRPVLHYELITNTFEEYHFICILLWFAMCKPGYYWCCWSLNIGIYQIKSKMTLGIAIAYNVCISWVVNMGKEHWKATWVKVARQCLLLPNIYETDFPLQSTTRCPH